MINSPASRLLVFLLFAVPLRAAGPFEGLRQKLTTQVGLKPSRELALHAQFVAEAHARSGKPY